MNDLEKRIDDFLSKKGSRKQKKQDLLRLIADDRRDFALAYLGVDKPDGPKWVEKHEKEI